MRKRNRSSEVQWGRAWSCAAWMLAFLMLGASSASAQLDICGCASAPSLGDFDSSDETSWPAGTTSTDTGSEITILLPEDGILIFDSMTIVDRKGGGTGTVSLDFTTTETNAPVTLLVKGDLTIGTSDAISVEGYAGSRGSQSFGGVGGLGGPGGFRGGDGAFQAGNLAANGGAGLGPGGGNGGTYIPPGPHVAPEGGQFVGIPELLPMIGGGGGGGGSSWGQGTACSAGGGGGGGGGILVAANGTFTINGSVSANGGANGNYYTYTCAYPGAGGSGGAIRLVASTLQGAGHIYAQGGVGGGGVGSIRLEAFTNTLAANKSTPAASRATTIGPIVNAVNPSVAITSVGGETISLANGQPISEKPQGNFNEIDIILTAPGTVDIELATTDVPPGTGVDVTAKLSVGGLPETQTATLSSCVGNACTAVLAFPLAAGSYFLEAQATFQTP